LTKEGDQMTKKESEKAIEEVKSDFSRGTLISEPKNQNQKGSERKNNF